MTDIDGYRFKQHDDIPKVCPKCEATPFVTFMRGAIGRSRRPWYWPFTKRKPYSIICHECKNIIGHEEHRIFDIMGTGHLSREDAQQVDDEFMKNLVKGQL